MREDLTKLQSDTLDIVVQHTRKDPVTGKDLANRIGLKERDTGKEGADMRSIIHALRVKNWPICATGRGYWYPTSQEELSAYLVSFSGRIQGLQEAYDGIKGGFGRIGLAEGQKQAVQAKVVRYTVMAGDVVKVFRVAGNRVEEFLREYPDAKAV